MTAAMIAGNGSYEIVSVLCSKTAKISNKFNVGKVLKGRITIILKVKTKDRAGSSRERIAMNGSKRRP